MKHVALSDHKLKEFIAYVKPRPMRHLLLRICLEVSAFILRRLQSEQRLKAGPNWHPYDLVFCTSEGKPLQRRNILRRHLRPILNRAGLSAELNLYSLRHSCATLLLAAGVNPKIVSERLGHASIVITLDVYSHVLPSMQQTAADKLEYLLFARV
jgi:integrase